MSPGTLTILSFPNVSGIRGALGWELNTLDLSGHEKKQGREEKNKNNQNRH